MNAPTGTVTFLFTDIEGSTRLWEDKPEAMRVSLAWHDSLMRQAVAENAGIVFKTIGDAFCCAFAKATDALKSALCAQLELVAPGSEAILPIHVRMAIHTGAVEHRDNDYFGQPLNRVARLLAAAHGGQVLLSEAAQDLTRDLLPAGASLLDLGEHRLRDLGRVERVYQLLHPDIPAEFPPLKTLNDTDLPNNLPRQVTSFIGREKEIETARTLLEKTRLLTLTGTGGSGKTRLGVQVASTLLGDYPDGAWLVELAPLTDPALVPQAVAVSLGLREEAGRSITRTLLDFLKDKRLLLLLDNCEHVLDACARLADSLLKNSRDVRILATSREALGISGERALRVPPLSIPDRRYTHTVETVTESESVRLFIERAAMVQQDFSVTPSNAPAIAQLCLRLDGIPLAIELAAARMRSLSVNEINARLDNCFHVLSGGGRTSVRRQQTLRALIDWSYDLLGDQEKALFARLSVFAGGWTLEAAEAVGASGDVQIWEVLDLLTSLVDKSLVVAEHDRGETRFRLMETIRQYAADKLEETGEGDAARARHLAFYSELGQVAEPQLIGPDQAAWLDRLERDHDNFRVALDRCSDGTGLPLAASLWRFWQARGRLSEGVDRLTLALSKVDAREPSPERAKALNGAGTLSRSQGNFAAARALQQECLALYHDMGDRYGVAYTLNNLGMVAYWRGDYIEARQLYGESLVIQRELDNKQGVAWSLVGLGMVANSRGDYLTARSLCEESVALQRELGDKQGTGWSLLGLGDVALFHGDYDEALAHYEESLLIQRELENKQGIAWALLGLGNIARYTDDLERARQLYRESLALYQDLGDKQGMAGSFIGLGDIARIHGDFAEACALYAKGLSTERDSGNKQGIAVSLEAFASAAAAQGQPDRALRLWGAAEALREEVGAPLPEHLRSRRDREIAAVRAVVDDSSFAAAWSNGRAMPMQQALDYALELVPA